MGSFCKTEKFRLKLGLQCHQTQILSAIVSGTPTYKNFNQKLFRKFVIWNVKKTKLVGHEVHYIFFYTQNSNSEKFCGLHCD